MKGGVNMFPHDKKAIYGMLFLVVLTMLFIAGCVRERRVPPLIYPEHTTNIQRGVTECSASRCHYQLSFEYVGFANDIRNFYQSAHYICKQSEKGSLESLAFTIDGPSWFCKGAGDMHSNIVVGFPQFATQNEQQLILVQAQVSWDDKLFP
jgi:hypothetical protein